MGEFQGFPRSLPAFWVALRLHNTVTDQPDMIEAYRRNVTEPLTRLHGDLAGEVARLAPGLCTRPSRCISTPFADRRFSQVPFKEYLYLRFRQEGPSRDVPGLFFDMGAQTYACGLRIDTQTAGGLARLRQRAPARLDDLQAALEALDAAGFAVIGERYKRDPCPELPDSRAKDLLCRRGFHIARERPVGPVIHTPALAGWIADSFALAAPLIDLLDKI